MMEYGKLYMENVSAEVLGELPAEPMIRVTWLDDRTGGVREAMGFFRPEPNGEYTFTPTSGDMLPLTESA
jgi:hypothetical protein